MGFKFKFSEINRCSYSINVVSLNDGIMALRMIFEQFKSFPTSYSALIYDDDLNVNGWGIEKYTEGYLFLMMCVVPGNGFEYGDGSIYAYRKGDNANLMEWPSVEFGKVPQHCFLKEDEIGKLVCKLYKSESPERIFDFKYDITCWEIISKVA